MTDFKKDMARIQTLVGDAFSATGGLVALSDGGVMSKQKLQQTLEQTAAEFEKAALEGELSLKGRLRIVTVLGIAWRLYRDKNVRYVYRRLNR